MRILFILPYLPVPVTFGGAMRVFHLIRLAAEQNDVSVVAYSNPEKQASFRSLLGGRVSDVTIVPTHWQWHQRRLAQLTALFSRHSFFYTLARSAAMQEAVSGAIGRKTFDVVQTEFAHMGSFALETDAVKILDAHNVEYDNFRRIAENSRSLLHRLHYYTEYKKFFREEQAACRRHEAVFVTSGRDKAMLDADVPEIPKYVVPNGVDASYFTPSADTPEPWSLVFTGAMSYVPNYDGMLYFLEQIFPLILKKVPQAKIYIVGSNPTQELREKASDNVVVTDFVDDVRPYAWRSSVYVVPLRMGSGTRLKVLEALALKKPIVTTSIGSEGINVVDGETALIADDPQAFADATVRLLHDRQLQRRLAENGEQLMRSQYEWSVIGEEVQRLYQDLLIPARRTPAIVMNNNGR